MFFLQMIFNVVCDWGRGVLLEIMGRRTEVLIAGIFRRRKAKRGTRTRTARKRRTLPL